MAVVLSFVVCSVLYATRSSAETTKVPIVVPPSGEWLGVDGPWSTFNLGVGSPVQVLKGVPGLNSPAIILPRPRDAPVDGITPFVFSNSSSWAVSGIYEIPLPSFVTQGTTAQNSVAGGMWGQDTVYLGGSLRDVASNLSLILATEEFDTTPTLGSTSIFGLSAGQVGISSATVPSLLESLYRVAATTPSRSFSYTAGSFKANSPGSLILGGYDTSRFDSSTTISIPMPSAQNNTLVVSVDTITISNDSSEAVWGTKDQSTASFNIDTTLSDLWLPEEACSLFQNMFQLIYDDTRNYYFINKTSHQRLLQTNPVVNITIRESTERAVTYTLPYTAFDHLYSNAAGGNGTNYYPLRRASNPSQYLLGRVFLQETYVSVDYDRLIFNLSQAYPGGGSSRVVTIFPPNNSTSTQNTTPLERNLSTGAIVGISVGAATLILSALGLLLYWKKGWLLFRKTSPSTEETGFDKAEMHGEAKPWVEAMGKERAELPVSEQSHEVTGSQPQAEVAGIHDLHELHSETR